MCVATFSAPHHLIVLVLKEGLRFLLPASSGIFSHFAFIFFSLFVCFFLVLSFDLPE